MNKKNLFQPGLLLALLLSAGLAATAVLTPIVRAGTITVTTTADDVTDNGNCTLREAVIAANTDTAVDACPAGAGADTIMVPAGDYLFLLAGTGEEAALTGDLDITEDVTILGEGRASTVINTNGLDRAFDVRSIGDVVQVANLTISGGPGAVGSAFYVGNGLLTLTNVRITGNGGSGSVIYFLHGTLTIVDSLIDNNSVTGLRVAGSDASATVINTAIYSNTATFDGGGISNSGTLRLANSTISGNSARQNGGGVYSGGTVELYNVTIANNQADSDADDDGLGGGLYISSGATLLARNTLIANNLDNSATTQHPNCSGTLNSLGYNLIEDTTGCTITGFSDGNVLGVDPALGPLQNNGGRTFTHALLAGSLAVNGGDPAGCRDYDNALLTTDQRVFARNGVCDIGAFEYNSPGPATPTATPTATHTPTATLTPISPTITATPTTTVSPTPNSEPPADYSVYLPLIQK